MVHLSNLLLGPDSLEVVDLQLRAGRDEPPQKVDAHMGLRVVVEVVLLAILPLEIIDITLVVVNALDLLLEKFKCKVSEEDALNKREDAADEGV